LPFGTPELCDSPRRKLSGFSAGVGFGLCESTREALAVEILPGKETGVCEARATAGSVVRRALGTQKARRQGHGRSREDKINRERGRVERSEVINTA